MLDKKHRNIGATVSMISMVHLLTPDADLPNAMTELFMLESGDCDYKHETGACIFNGSIEPNQKCMVGNCPLGGMLDKELNQ
jgi:hypothetical protein